MLNIFSLIYFIWILLAVVLFFIVYYIFKDKSKEFQFKLLVGFTILTWVLHFLRFWLDPDMKTFELFFVDFCGFNTMMLPFLLLSRKQVAYDIMYLCGSFFALHSLIYPNNIEGNPILYYDTIRFFFAHFLLVGILLWMIMWGMYKPSVKSVKWATLYLAIGAMYNIGLTAIFVETGLRTTLVNYMGLWGNDVSVYNYAEKLAPFFRYDSIVDGVVVNKPIPFLYMLPSLLFVYVPLWILMTIPFSKKIKVKNL